MANRPAPAPRRPQPRAISPSPASGGPSGSGAGATFLKLLLFAGVVGGAAWIGYGEYRKRMTATVAEPAPEKKPVVREKLPDIKRDDVPDVRPPEKHDDEPVKEPGPAKVEALPGLPPLQRSEALAALRDATLARIADGRWAEHAKILAVAARAAIDERPRTGGKSMLDRLTDKTALPLALAQLDIFTRLSPDELAGFSKDDPAFAGRVLGTPELAELFVNNLKPEDRPADALRVWRALDAMETTPADKERFRNLAVALALIHDKNNGESKAGEIYAYYRDADKRHRLYVDLEKIRPDELVWGVGDHSFGLEDQRWALKNVSFGLAQLGKAYPSVPYRMNHEPYPEYTMENVLKMGGICMNQGQYAVGNARARAVPSAYITGEGSRGGHAWFGFRGPRGWVHNVGRYEDGYACGMTGNPQTGKAVREWDLALFNDPARRTGDLDAALRLARAAKVVGDAGDAEGALNLLEAAVERDKGSPYFWRLRFEALLASGKERPADYWSQLVNSYRIALRDFPDYFDIADRIETEKIFPKMDQDRVGEFLRNRRHRSMRENPARFDLLVESIRREADYYRSRKENTRVGFLYNAALREYGKNLPTFIRLADDFGKLAVELPVIRKAGLTTLENVFNKDVDSKLKGDAFALAMQARAANKLSETFALDGEDRKAGKYADRARIIQTKADEERKAMR